MVDVYAIEYVHARVYTFVSVGVEDKFVSGSTVYSDIIEAVLGVGAKLYTAYHEGGDSARGIADGKFAVTSIVKSFVSNDSAGEDPARSDGIISSGVDDKVGAVETTVSAVCTV